MSSSSYLSSYGVNKTNKYNKKFYYKIIILSQVMGLLPLVYCIINGLFFDTLLITIMIISSISKYISEPSYGLKPMINTQYTNICSIFYSIMSIITISYLIILILYMINGLYVHDILSLIIGSLSLIVCKYILNNPETIEEYSWFIIFHYIWNSIAYWMFFRIEFLTL